MPAQFYDHMVELYDRGEVTLDDISRVRKKFPGKNKKWLDGLEEKLLKMVEQHERDKGDTSVASPNEMLMKHEADAKRQTKEEATLEKLRKGQQKEGEQTVEAQKLTVETVEQP